MALKSGIGARNTGKPSELLFEEGMKAKGYAVFRLRDKADLYGLNKKNVAAFGQPADYVVVTEQGAFFAEVKSTSNKTSFPLDCFTTAQKAAMAICHGRKVAHCYLIYVHCIAQDQWFLCNANLIVNTIKSGKKSIKWCNLNPIFDFKGNLNHV